MTDDKKKPDNETPSKPEPLNIAPVLHDYVAHGQDLGKTETR